MKALLGFGLVFLLTTAVCADSLAGKTAYISVKTAAVKSSSGFFAKSVGELGYGEAVKVTADDGKWAEVRTSGKKPLAGFLPIAALTTKRIVASSAASTSAGELALAGKGFNADVERAYQTESKLDFKPIDEMEKTTIEAKTLQSFIGDGRLAGGGK
ncbi:hypothetical protein FACS189487_03750 [Campylobacterota bacterium]|nr:hypothetical protein FACS189487_03750 [Campylobacterota bacterium]